MNSTDSIFFWMTATAAVLYAFYAITRRGDAPDYRKPVIFWRDTFLIFFVIFLFRGFVFDWFSIPSNSMQPTLRIGDRVLVKKFEYGIRLPVLNFPLAAFNEPRRGDIAVFYMTQKGQFFIKRIIAVPGDSVRVDNKDVYVNDQRLKTRQAGDGAYRYVDRGGGGISSGGGRRARLFAQEIEGRGWFNILRDDGNFGGNAIRQNPDEANCKLLGNALFCRVPPDNYFMMGDNRDNSHDSRFWGFVHRDDLVGPAISVLFNWVEQNRTGKPLLPAEEMVVEENPVLTEDSYVGQ